MARYVNNDDENYDADDNDIMHRDLGFPRQENANSAASFCIFRDFTRKIRGKKYGIPRQIN